jgi:hypothetical protein
MLVTFVGMIQCVMCYFVSGIDRQKSNFLMQTMAHQVEYGSASEASEFFEVEDDASPAHSGNGPSESSEWSSFISPPPPHLQSQMMMLVLVLMHFVSARMRTPYLSAVPVAPFLSLTLIAQGAR